MIGILITLILLVSIGCSLTLLGWSGKSISMNILILVGSAVGLLALGVIGYSILIVVSFSILTVYLVLSTLALVLVMLVVKKRRHLLVIYDKKINRRRIIRELAALLIATTALFLRLRSVFASETLSAVDPWFWLYNTRYMLLTGGVDYSIAQAYPMGFVFLCTSFCLPTPDYMFVYDLIRFIGPAISFITTYAVFKIIEHYFDDWRIGMLGGMGFATGMLLQFRGRLATPETISLYFFVIFLAYLYVYRERTPWLIALMLAGLVIYHPTTALIAAGIVLLTELKIPTRDIIHSEVKELLTFLIIFLILLLPMLVALSLNNDIISRYGYYGNAIETAKSFEDVVIAGYSLVTYSLGGHIFGLSFLGAILYLVGNRKSRWAFVGWGICLLWSLLAFIPIVFFDASSPRAATFIVFPAMVLVGEVVLKLEEVIEGFEVQSPTFLKSVDMRKTLVLGLILSAQLIYGLGYFYYNERYISDAGLETLEWVASSELDVDTIYVYEEWDTYNIARAVLMEMTIIANDTVRNDEYANVAVYIEMHSEYALIVTERSEQLYADLIANGFSQLFANSEYVIFLFDGES